MHVNLSAMQCLKFEGSNGVKINRKSEEWIKIDFLGVLKSSKIGFSF